MDIKKLLGKRIKELRKLNKLTQEQLAEIINIDPTSMSNIERGEYYPSSINLEKILEALHTEPSKLFYFEHLQDNHLLINEINNMLVQNPDKIKDIYKVVKALMN